MKDYDINWYKEVLNSMRDMVLVKGPKSQLLWANKSFLNYYGMTEDELKNIIDAPHSDPDDTLQYVIDDQTVFDTKKDLDIPSESVTNSKGEVRQFHTIKSPIFEDNKMVRSVGVSRLLQDTKINSREHNHEDAKVFTAPLRSFTSSFPLPMILIDIKERIVTSSPLWTYHFDEFENSPDAFFIDSFPKLSELNRTIEYCLKNKKHSEATITYKIGKRTRYYDFHLSPWYYLNGAIGGLNIVASEITHIKQNEKTLKQANDELAQFSYRASHDLKAPLSTVKALSHFIIKDIKNKNLDEAIVNSQKIKNMMERLENLVIDILDLAKADLKQDTPSNVNANEVVENIINELSSFAEEKKVNVEKNVNISKDIFIEKTRFQQILENLINNSIKYSNPKQKNKFVKVDILNTNDNLIIKINDNGLGFPKENLKDIFKMFCRFHPKVGSGSGLGMSIAKKHIDYLKGHIDFQTSEEGTSFEITIPNKR